LPLTSRSGKRSCSTQPIPGDDTDDAHGCDLYVLHGIVKTLVARGTIFEAGTLLHGIELMKDEVKVTVEEVLVLDALVLMPTNEVYIVAQTFQSFLAWPKDLVGSIFDPRYGPPNTPYNTLHFKFTCYLCS